MTFVEDPQRPERVRIEVSEDHEDKNDGHTLNDMTGPQPPKERTDSEVEVGVEGQEEVGAGVEVEKRGEVESAAVEEKRDDRLTKTHQSGRSRRAPARDNDPRFTRTSYTRRKTPGDAE